MVFGTRSGDDPLLQILLEWRDHGRSAGAGYTRIKAAIKAAPDVFADRLTVAFQLPGDRRDRQPLPMHRRAPPADREGSSDRR